MKFSLLSFIVKRLTLSKRNKGVVHVIALISLIGVSVGTFALVVVLSVFNGFTSVATDMLSKSCPPVLIEAKKGKIINTDIIKSLPEYTYIPVIKTTAMVSVGDNRTIATVIGIDSSFFLFSPVDTCIVLGKEEFNLKDPSFCFMGINLASYLGLGKGAEKMNIPVRITVPNTSETTEAMVIDDKLQTLTVFYQSSFQTHSDSDGTIVFISLDNARQLLNMQPKECNFLYLADIPENKTAKIQKELQQILCKDYNVKTILEQEPVYFRIVKSEKLAVYIILAFIIFIATINIISTVIILNIQKQKMNKILRTMGMTINDLRKIYFGYAILINIAGCVLGIAAGLVLCLLQQHFGLIKLAEDAFVVNAFPVKILFKDIVSTFALVISIGAISIGAITFRIKPSC